MNTPELATIVTDPSKLISVPFEMAKSALTFSFLIVDQCFSFAQEMFRVFL